MAVLLKEGKFLAGLKLEPNTDKKDIKLPTISNEIKVIIIQNNVPKWFKKQVIKKYRGKFAIGTIVNKRIEIIYKSELFPVGFVF